MRPSALLIDGTPGTGLSVISVAPVSVNGKPGVGVGFLPVFTKSAIACTPIAAIFSGYCCDVAPSVPAATLRTPGQPPSTATNSTLFALSSAFSAS